MYPTRAGHPLILVQLDRATIGILDGVVDEAVGAQHDP